METSFSEALHENIVPSFHSLMPYMTVNSTYIALTFVAMEFYSKSPDVNVQDDPPITALTIPHFCLNSEH